MCNIGAQDEYCIFWSLLLAWYVLVCKCKILSWFHFYLSCGVQSRRFWLLFFVSANLVQNSAVLHHCTPVLSSVISNAIVTVLGKVLFEVPDQEAQTPQVIIRPLPLFRLTFV